ncbi:hypothetical protein [Sphaerisporangium rubeum]|uniref:Uncharacterized protein n=1 Tax=Sphaerisporangium rubeum TaxID=321317 RepID=A0A7X0M9D6_9ACTN|nr:hypothetical protein [Sphaerisporangium rubeum]MBB6474831.1 hypothetical protein [Sphaerisporangium rubeum]
MSAVDCVGESGKVRQRLTDLLGEFHLQAATHAASLLAPAQKPSKSARRRANDHRWWQLVLVARRLFATKGLQDVLELSQSDDKGFIACFRRFLGERLRTD